MRFALDTNVLVYAEGLNDEERRMLARDLIGALVTEDVVVPVQALGELHRVLTWKGGLSPAESKEAVSIYAEAFEVRPTTQSAFSTAMDLAAEHKFSIWDAIIFSVALEAGCEILLSEDMHAGFCWRGLTIVNPFHAEPHPLLSGLLAQRRSQ